jgi:hypothetical protein
MSTRVTPALRTYTALSWLRDGDLIDLPFDPAATAAFGQWALDTADLDPASLALHPPPWAYDYDPFTFADLAGFLLAADDRELSPTDPASFTVRAESTDSRAIALHAPVPDAAHVQCLVACVNAGFVYGQSARPLAIAVATLAATARMTQMRSILP